MYHILAYNFVMTSNIHFIGPPTMIILAERLEALCLCVFQPRAIRPFLWLDERASGINTSFKKYIFNKHFVFYACACIFYIAQVDQQQHLLLFISSLLLFLMVIYSTICYLVGQSTLSLSVVHLML